MDRRAARAQVYTLLALPLGLPDQQNFEAVASGQWAAELVEALRRADPELLPLSSDLAGSRPVCQVERIYDEALVVPGHPVRPIESLYKPWTSDPTAQTPMAREKGWLGGDSAAHLRDLFNALQIPLPEAFAHAPDHLALELELMALLVEQGEPEQQTRFRTQHLDWLDDLAAKVQDGATPAFYRELISLAAQFVRRDRP